MSSYFIYIRQCDPSLPRGSVLSRHYMVARKISIRSWEYAGNGFPYSIVHDGELVSILLAIFFLILSFAFSRDADAAAPEGAHYTSFSVFNLVGACLELGLRRDYCFGMCRLTRHFFFLPLFHFLVRSGCVQLSWHFKLVVWARENMLMGLSNIRQENFIGVRRTVTPGQMEIMSLPYVSSCLGNDRITNVFSISLFLSLLFLEYSILRNRTFDAVREPSTREKYKIDGAEVFSPKHTHTHRARKFVCETFIVNSKRETEDNIYEKNEIHQRRDYLLVSPRDFDI